MGILGFFLYYYAILFINLFMIIFCFIYRHLVFIIIIIIILFGDCYYLLMTSLIDLFLFICVIVVVFFFFFFICFYWSLFFLYWPLFSAVDFQCCPTRGNFVAERKCKLYYFAHPNSRTFTGLDVERVEWCWWLGSGVSLELIRNTHLLQFE